METIFEILIPDQTIWSQIELAKADRKTLELVIGRYIPVVRNALKRRGLSDQDCEDLGQEFLADKFLRTLHQADRQKGKFRSFLLNALDWYLGDWHRRQSAEKRGRGITGSLENMEENGTLLPTVDSAASTEIDTDFAFEIHDAVIALLRSEYARRDQSGVFELLRPWVFDQEPGLDKTLAAQSQLQEATVRKGISRLRTRYKAHFLEQIRVVLDRDENPEIEAMELFKLLLKCPDRLRGAVPSPRQVCC